MGFIVYIRNKSWLVKGFLFLSLFCFGTISLLSVYETLKRKSPNVAFVHGEPIDQFNYGNIVNLYSGAGYNGFQAHQQTWNLFVTHIGLKKIAEEGGIILSEEEINLTMPPGWQYISSKHSQKQARMSAEIKLYTKKLETLFSNSNLDIEQELGVRKPMNIEFRYILIPSKEVNVNNASTANPLSPEEINQYWKDHEDTFVREPGVKVDVIHVKISPSDEDIDNWQRKIAVATEDWKGMSEEEEVLNFINRYHLEDPQSMIWYTSQLLPWQRDAMKLLKRRGIYKRFIREDEQDICILYKFLKKFHGDGRAGYEVVKVIIPLEVSMKTKDIIKGELSKLTNKSKDLATWELSTKEAGIAEESIEKMEITKKIANRLIATNIFEDQVRKKYFLEGNPSHFEALEPFQFKKIYIVAFVRDFKKGKSSSLNGIEKDIEKQFYRDQLANEKVAHIQRVIDDKMNFRFIRQRFSDLAQDDEEIERMDTNSYAPKNKLEYWHLYRALPEIANMSEGDISVWNHEGMLLVCQLEKKKDVAPKENNTSSMDYNQVFSEAIFDDEKVIDNRCFYF